MALTATAASAAVPPVLRTSTPASVASGCAEATIPSRPRAKGRCEYPTSGTLASREELGDLVPREDRHRPLHRSLDQLHALLARDHLPNVVTIDALTGEGVDHDPRVGGSEGHEEGAGGDRPERIQTEGSAQLDTLGQHDDPVGVDTKPDAGGLGQ